MSLLIIFIFKGNNSKIFISVHKVYTDRQGLLSLYVNFLAHRTTCLSANQSKADKRL